MVSTRDDFVSQGTFGNVLSIITAMYLSIITAIITAGGCYWHLVQRPKMCLNILRAQIALHHKELSSLNVSCPEVEKPWALWNSLRKTLPTLYGTYILSLCNDAYFSIKCC